MEFCQSKRNERISDFFSVLQIVAKQVNSFAFYFFCAMQIEPEKPVAAPSSGVATTANPSALARGLLP